MIKHLLSASMALLALGATAQQKQLTAQDYQQAEKFMSYNTGPLLERSQIYFAPDSRSVIVSKKSKRSRYDIATNTITADTLSVNGGGSISRPPGTRGFGDVASPDGKKAAFIRNFNLWVRDVATSKETQLTTDGIKDFGYATDNAGWKKSNRAILLWSPDSKKIATFKQDERNVSDMYLVTTNVGEPTLSAWKYPLPGDKEVQMLHRVVIDVESVKVIPIKVAPDPHRSTLSDDIVNNGSFADVEWSPDAAQLAFVSTSRDHKQEKFRIADAATGAVREVFEETVATQFESGLNSIAWRFLPASKEIIWYSERDNWGHLYLYDATTGKMKNQITKGNWVVGNVLQVDEKSRTIYFTAVGREPNQNVYFEHFYKIGFDGKGLTLLTPEVGNHSVTLSSNKQYFIDTYSQPDVAPVTTLRDVKGKLITTLEKTDLTKLKAAGWKAPAPFVVKARDGQTDLYGLMYTPTTLDPSKKYPVIDYIYPGPQGGSVGSWSFAPTRGDNQALAELGFIVVQLEGTCNPNRSKAFHDMCYGDMSENTLPDQITGIQQLAKKYSYMDLDRVGIWGHSGGGFATAAALLRYPDFFKVGISESGNHDNRNYEDNWGERYVGLLQPMADGKSNYEMQANQNYAKNLKGKLMLAHGMMDNNVPPYNTLLVVEALEKANKDYDLVIFPNSAHGYGEYSLYMTRRRWDYFVRYLLGAEPPAQYKLNAAASGR
jgi:dipeptidyl-peptidase-4